MGFIKTLFGSKQQGGPQTVVKQPDRDASAHDSQINLSSLVLLSLAENYKTEEKQYPDYLRSKYGIGFPNELFKTLEKDGFLKPSSVVKTLYQLKTAQLQEIAKRFDLKAGGKKDLCSRIIETVPESELETIISDRYWEITEEGHKLLERHPYVGFYLEKHPYSLDEIGLDLEGLHDLFSANSSGRIRDVLWGEFNRKSIKLYSNGQNSGDFQPYCNLLRVMALFLEEENRHTEAMREYVRYIYYRTNFDAGYKALRFYSIVKKEEDTADQFYINAEILPFIAKEWIGISNECGLDSAQLRKSMLEAFSKEEDKGIFSPEELTEFVMLGLNGDKLEQRKMCAEGIRTAIKKLPKKKK